MPPRPARLRSVLTLALTLALTIACAQAVQAGGPDPAPAPPAAQALSGTWKLVSLDGKAPDLPAAEERRRPELTFAPDAPQAFGQSGCNRFHGGYTLDAKGLRFVNMASTRMACPGPLMDLEQRFLDMLSQARRFRVEEGRLLLLGEDGRTLATFEPK